jgi:hypothetical protein
MARSSVISGHAQRRANHAGQRDTESARFGTIPRGGQERPPSISVISWGEALPLC